MSGSKQKGMDEILQRWRKEIKGKMRRIISFEETVEIKINSLKAWIYPETETLDGWEYRPFKYTIHRERIFDAGDWRPIATGQKWGGPDGSALFRCSARMPARFKDKKVVLKVYFGGDGLLSLNGKPFQGLDPFRDTVYLTEKAVGNEVYQFDVESYIMWHFGESEIKDFECSYFAVMDPEMSRIYWDFRAAYNVLVVPKQDVNLFEYLKSQISKCIFIIDQNETDPVKFRDNARRAHAILRKTIYDSDRFKKSGLLHLCGNSHLDVVFLWTHAEFVRKLGRTHASTLRLMEQYPNYIFSQSQPLMYQEMKDNYPSMYEEVKQRVKEGRWEVIGASWVEPDCNIISGESFVRQIMYGVQFVEREFGITPQTYWCPDVFGNGWTMPQIIKRSGLKYFVTHKMGVWNDTNPWRKNTFWWQGPDGSRVFSLMPPTHFIGSIEPDHMAEHWERFTDKGDIGETLYNFGWGDGGGGPDAEMLEYQERYGDFPGVVATRPNTIEGALESIYQASANADLSVWNDELYLEEHRGVHTTKARLKKLNRYCELLYRNAELFASFCAAYPQAKITAGWLDILTNQFHDSLPGSHITPVYSDLLEAYARATAIGEEVLTTSLAAIARVVNTAGAGKPVVVFNPLGHARDTVVYVDCAQGAIHVVDQAGSEVASQFITHYETGKTMLAFTALNLPAAGFSVYRIIDGVGKTHFDNVAVSTTRIENELVTATIDGDGQIVSLIDKKSGREFMDAAQKGNVLKLYEDVPGKYEAWDIAPSYVNVTFEIDKPVITVLENGPVRSSVLVSRKIRNSVFKQRIVLCRNGKRLDFETYVDWKEQQKMLKVRFNTTLQSRTATYDIAFGSIDRSSYRNNSYDEAKFEVPGHFWMDMSQPDCGLSLLNNCKYGHEALGGMISLTLLRGPINPDPTSDQEEHWFTYSLYPHERSWQQGGTVAEALDLNNQAVALITTAHAGTLADRHSFVSVDANNVTLEAVKKAEKSDHVIVRLVERHGMQNPVTVTVPGGITFVTECNLLEREDTPVAAQGTAFAFVIKPFEIRTFKIKTAAFVQA